MGKAADAANQPADQPMRLLTLSDVRDKIQQHFCNSKPGTITAEAWAKLDQIVASHVTDSGPHDDLQRIWRIRRIEISRFRGTSPEPDQPLTLELADCPGITVFHGVNGSGKSTIADALHAALHPEYHPGEPATKARVDDDPWDAFDVHVDAEDAEVRVTVRSDDGEEMQFVTCIDGEGSVRRTMLRGRDEKATPAQREAGWDEAYKIHRPVFSYAREHRSIRRADDLREFLVGHLLIGGCLDSIRNEVSPRLNAARDANEAANSAWQKFEEALKRIAQQYPEAPEHRVAKPSPSQSQDDWLNTNGLAGEHAEQAAPQVTAEQIERCSTTVRKAHTALQGYQEAASASWGPLLRGLELLFEQASTCDSLPDDECPVCGSQADWLANLAGRLEELKHIAAPRKRAEGAFAELRGEPMDCLGALAALLTMNDPRRPHQDWVAQVSERLLTLGRVRTGSPHDPEMIAAVTEIKDFIDDDRFDELAHHVVGFAQSLQDWNRARRQAAQEFAEIWWTNRNAAAGLKVWRTADSNLRKLNADVHKDREDEFRDVLSTVFERLLGDAGLAPAGLAIAAKTAAPTFSPSGDGQTARPLGALSAGQHNAFLLAPVICPRSPRPFGFAVFDDPVHALDDLRIDALAAYLCERAETHQVLVFTHDERLTEILRHSTVDSRFFTVQRDPATSVITTIPDKPLWVRLLDACSDALNPDDSQIKVKPGVARRLMRQAVDSALRDALLKYVAVTPGAETTGRLQRLADARTTAKRFDHLINDYSGTALADAASKARTHVASDILIRWNRASHRDEGVPLEDIRAERKLANRACQALSPYTNGAA